MKLVKPNKPSDDEMRSLAVIAFGVLVICGAGFGFVYKMSEFVMTIVKDEVEGFGVVAVAIYLTGLIPVICLMMWAIVTGKFRDIEAPKYRLFELEAEIERGGELGA